MSVLKNRATSSLLQSEKRSLLRFLALYSVLTLLLVGGLSYYYFESQKALMLSDKRATLSEYAYEQVKRLKALHQAFPQKRTYPRDQRFTSAIYDIEYYKIFSLNRIDPVDFFQEISLHDGVIHYIKDMDIFYLGARYLVLEVPDDGAWARKARRNIAVYGGGALVVLALLGLYLARLFVKPMRDAILLLDRFIADTTHELNTPLTTILSNIETIDAAKLDERTRKKFARIASAAKSVSVLYRDLTYLVLEKKRRRHRAPVDMKGFVKKRLAYFETVAQNKQVRFETTLESVCLYVDSKDMERLVDNLLSNAIKYNKRGGKVYVGLDRHGLRIEDTGIGIDEERLSLLFDRYLRFSEQEGGFGIGLSIVREIVSYYGWRIDVSSEKGAGSMFEITWHKEELC